MSHCQKRATIPFYAGELEESALLFNNSFGVKGSSSDWYLYYNDARNEWDDVKDATLLSLLGGIYLGRNHFD